MIKIKIGKTEYSFGFVFNTKDLRTPKEKYEDYCKRHPLTLKRIIVTVGGKALMSDKFPEQRGCVIHSTRV